MTAVDFTFFDTIAGYVTQFNRSEKSFTLKTSDGRDFEVFITPTTYARIPQNLNESYINARFAELLMPGQFVYAYGVFYPEAGGHKFETHSMVFPGDAPESYRHEEPDWWLQQIRSIGHSYLKRQFNHPAEPIDYRNYPTFLHLGGGKKTDFLPQPDPISRLVYVFASSFLLTGQVQFPQGADKAPDHLHHHIPLSAPDDPLIYWYHYLHFTAHR